MNTVSRSSLSVLLGVFLLCASPPPPLHAVDPPGLSLTPGLSQEAFPESDSRELPASNGRVEVELFDSSGTFRGTAEFEGLRTGRRTGRLTDPAGSVLEFDWDTDRGVLILSAGRLRGRSVFNLEHSTWVSDAAFQEILSMHRESLELLAEAQAKIASVALAASAGTSRRGCGSDAPGIYLEGDPVPNLM